MTALDLADPERPPARDAALTRMALALLGLVALLWLLPLPLSWVPEPIGPAARAFGEGARTTVLLTLISGAFGLVLGVATALAATSRNLGLRLVAQGYVWVIRGTPLITQILFVYFALPAILPGLRLPDFWAAVVALSLNVGAYNAEVVRAGILAIPRGQTEAAIALGLPRLLVLRLVILPQAFRLSLPPLVNNLVALLKDSSLAYTIGVVELSLIGNRVQAESFQPVPVFITVACVYLALTTVLTCFTQALERWLGQPRTGSRT